MKFFGVLVIVCILALATAWDYPTDGQTAYPTDGQTVQIVQTPYGQAKIIDNGTPGVNIISAQGIDASRVGQSSMVDDNGNVYGADGRGADIIFD